jgi:hypothetical protein
MDDIVCVIPPQDERFWNAILACVLLRKNFRNDIPS